MEVVACAELLPETLKLLQERVKAKKAYPSCEEMIRHAGEDKLEAVYIATDAPSHCQFAILALEQWLKVSGRGKQKSRLERGAVLLCLARVAGFEPATN